MMSICRPLIFGTLYRHYGAAMRRGAIRVLKIGRSVRIIWSSLLDEIEREGDNNGRR